MQFSFTSVLPWMLMVSAASVLVCIAGVIVAYGLYVDRPGETVTRLLKLRDGWQRSTWFRLLVIGLRVIFAFVIAVRWCWFIGGEESLVRPILAMAIYMPFVVSPRRTVRWWVGVLREKP